MWENVPVSQSPVGHIEMVLLIWSAVQSLTDIQFNMCDKEKPQSQKFGRFL